MTTAQRGGGRGGASASGTAKLGQKQHDDRGGNGKAATAAR